MADGDHSGSASTLGMIVRFLAVLASLLLAGFFGFVGYMKAFAPITELAAHGAWTVHLPATAGRLVGWSEMACAAILLICPFLANGRGVWAIASGLLVLNQFVAAWTHYVEGESEALPQNALLIAICACLCANAFNTYRERSTGELK